MILTSWKEWPTELMTCLSYTENSIVRGDTVDVEKQVAEMSADIKTEMFNYSLSQTIHLIFSILTSAF